MPVTTWEKDVGTGTTVGAKDEGRGVEGRGVARAVGCALVGLADLLLPFPPKTVPEGRGVGPGGPWKTLMLGRREGPATPDDEEGLRTARRRKGGVGERKEINQQSRPVFERAAAQRGEEKRREVCRTRRWT